MEVWNLWSLVQNQIEVKVASSNVTHEYKTGTREGILHPQDGKELGL